MGFTSKYFSSYEQIVSQFKETTGLPLPIQTAGSQMYFRGLNSWLRSSEKDQWSVVLPDPALNLSQPFATDEISLALSASRKYAPDFAEIADFAKRFRFSAELLGRPVNALSGGERMLLGICKAVAMSEKTGNICLFSPYFWLDSKNASVVTDLKSSSALSVELLMLEGEDDSKFEDVLFASDEPEVTWSLFVKNSSVVFGGTVRPEEKTKKIIKYSALEDLSNLRSPTLISGPNGSGKTTLARLLSGTLTPRTGKIAATSHSFSGKARMLMQNSIAQLFSGSPLEHLERVFAYDKEKRKEAKKLYRTMEDEIANGVAGRFDSFVIGDREIPNSVLQSKIALAVERVLTFSPVLILDEPGWCLSKAIAREFMAQVVKAAHERKIAIVIISHQPAWWDGMIAEHLMLSPSKSGEVFIERRRYHD
jgi:energy-coupling factor transporter ATP-binding protein EcfA2